MRTRFQVVQPAHFKLEVILRDLPEDISMDNVDFSCVFSSGGKSVTKSKTDLHVVATDAGNRYIAPLNSGLLGKGDVTMIVTANIPDEAFDNGMRKDIDMCDTKVTIV